MRLEKTLGIAVSLTILISVVVAVESRYARAAELEQHISNAQIEFYELYILRAHDQLDMIEGKPEQKEWERKEVLRLHTVIKRYLRKIERVESLSE